MIGRWRNSRFHTDYVLSLRFNLPTNDDEGGSRRRIHRLVIPGMLGINIATLVCESHSPVVRKYSAWKAWDGLEGSLVSTRLSMA